MEVEKTYQKFPHNETVDRHRLRDTTPLPVDLKETPIVPAFTLTSSVPLDLLQEDRIGKEDIVELKAKSANKEEGTINEGTHEAIGVTGMELFYLGISGLQNLVHPKKSLLSRYILESRRYYRLSASTVHLLVVSH